MRRLAALFALISTAVLAQDAREVLNQGIAAFKNAHYQQAVELFQQAASLDPNAVNPHLYLGTSYMSMWIPGATTPENAVLARSAETEFRRVLELDANNTVALDSMASLAYNSASGLQGEEKLHKLDEAMDWYKRVSAVSPSDKVAYYSMGVIAWAKWYPALMTARTSLGMKPQDPGPLTGPAREQLRAQYSSVIEDGIANLNRALQLDPDYADAMAYLNLLIRERGDLRDTRQEWAADTAEADQWVQKNLAVKKAQAQSGVMPPPPPPPPTRIRVGANVQAANLITKVDPVYPPLAMQARISGQVRFTVTIGKDGSIQNIQLVSGHPLLVAAAKDAVQQYVYKPTLLNGNPVEVITQVDVNFSLTN
ncbi:MAG TPA: TonB family protein [Bryobacteraceae bacterium]|jgi:TonB family protein|nr:TonB family protein [Bryobacteraceae bacterium]